MRRQVFIIAIKADIWNISQAVAPSDDYRANVLLFRSRTCGITVHEIWVDGPRSRTFYPVSIREKEEEEEEKNKLVSTFLIKTSRLREILSLSPYFSFSAVPENFVEATKQPNEIICSGITYQIHAVQQTETAHFLPYGSDGEIDLPTLKRRALAAFPQNLGRGESGDSVFPRVHLHYEPHT